MNSRSSVIKIAVVGPESTGKSTLSKQLAEHYKAGWVPEYSREYCSNLTAPVTPKDELNIFYGQISLEDRLSVGAGNLLICDTTILTVKIWCDYVFKETPKVVLKELDNREYDLYLLMNIDLPWEEDPLRDFPDLRDYFLNVWEKELIALEANYVLISGNNEIRFKNSVTAVDKFLTNSYRKV